MRTPARLLLCLLLLGIAPTFRLAQADDEPASKEAPQTVTLHYDEMDARQALAAIAQVGHANVIIDPRITGKLTIDLRSTPWRESLEQVATTLGAVVVDEGHGVLRIVPASHAPSGEKVSEAQVSVVAHEGRRGIVLSNKKTVGTQTRSLQILDVRDLDPTAVRSLVADVQRSHPDGARLQVSDGHVLLRGGSPGAEADLQRGLAELRRRTEASSDRPFEKGDASARLEDLERAILHLRRAGLEEEAARAEEAAKEIRRAQEAAAAAEKQRRAAQRAADEIRRARQAAAEAEARRKAAEEARGRLEGATGFGRTEGSDTDPVLAAISKLRAEVRALTREVHALRESIEATR